MWAHLQPILMMKPLRSSTFKKSPKWGLMGPFLGPFPGPLRVFMSFWCPNAFIWAHLQPILMMKPLRSSLFKKWSQMWCHGTIFMGTFLWPFLGPLRVFMPFWCPNSFMWAHLQPILVIKSLRSSTFKKWSQMGSHGTPFGNLLRPPRGLKFFWGAGNS